MFFSTAVSIWDADFYVKVDDDVHLNLGISLFDIVAEKKKKLDTVTYQLVCHWNIFFFFLCKLFVLRWGL